MMSVVLKDGFRNTGYDIVQYGNVYFCLARGDGAIDVDKINGNG